MNNQELKRENARLLQQLSTVCASMEANRIEADQLVFPRWDLRVCAQIDSLDERALAVCTFEVE